MGLNWKDWTLKDVIYAIIAPVVVVLIIVGLSLVSSSLRTGGGMSSPWGIVIGLISEIEEMVVIVAIPLVLGLVWNRWAGGASGFIMGSFYAMWNAIKYSQVTAGTFMRGDAGFGPTILGYVLSAMLIGYMAGALNKGSGSFRRMLIAAVIATTVGGVLLFGMYQLSPSNVMVGTDAFLLTVLARTATGALIAIIAQVFMWYGIAIHKHQG
ncbi:MAG: hypothetical protein ACQCN5_07865 [Candidatus Bathyarchaeia archaeon]|jgi:hypothetical protein